MRTFHLDFNGTKVTFRTDFDAYADYLRSYFQQIISDKEERGDIDITFHWDGDAFGKFNDALKQTKDVIRIGANTFIMPDGAATDRKIERRWKLKFLAKQTEKRLQLDIYLQRKPLKDFFRFGPLAKPAHEWFFNVTYYLLYYPLFWQLACRHKMFPLHASALRHEGKGIVICGLEGIGKTSLGLKFLKEGEASFLSDNLVFFDDKEVHSCYELVRMHAGEDDDLWKGSFEKVNDFQILKGFFRPLQTPSEERIRPDVLIFPEFAGRFFIEELSPKGAAGRALILSHLPAELNNYLEFRHFYNLLDQSFDPGREQRRSLEALLEGVRCIRVGMNKEDGLDRNFEKLKGAMGS